MKYSDEYRDRAIADALIKRIDEVISRPIRLMEICGTHTMSVFKHGIKSMLPSKIELVSGPGCPVCVTANCDIDRFIALADIKDVIVTTFGDMLRVPGSRASLAQKKALGADIRMVYSTFDALDVAAKNKERPVVFLGVGFETTAPTVAAAVKLAYQRGVENFSVISAHKLLPPAMQALLQSGELAIDGFLCPGHVTTIIGTAPYERICDQYRVPCVVAGFEPLDILHGLLMLAEQIANGSSFVQIQYSRGVSEQGNKNAQELMEEVFFPCDSVWRGLGSIPMSGLGIRDAYSAFDAQKRFALEVEPPVEVAGCKCSDILRGVTIPPKCSLFRKICTPSNPIGPCMVSSEGSCAAYFKYHIS